MRMTNRLSPARIALAALLGSALPLASGAQVLASERGTVTQTLDGTTLSVEYFRPVARGRALFGSLVKWGEPWTPGANWATTLETDHDVTVNGQPLPKGKYTIWAVPQAKEWTVIFDRRARVFHMRGPDKAEEALRVTVRPEEAPHTETLTWSFPTVLRDAATLRLQWGTTAVPLRIEVPASHPYQLSQAERAGLLGTYELTYKNDSGKTVTERMDIVARGDTIAVRGNPLEPEEDANFDLFPIAEHQFYPGYYEKGKYMGVEPAELYVFTTEGTRATGFEIRGTNGTAYAWGKRVK
jgi:hypothetical protein